eukprot:4376178-Ditylum_brightwellii.AAC.1
MNKFTISSCVQIGSPLNIISSILASVKKLILAWLLATSLVFLLACSMNLIVELRSEMFPTVDGPVIENACGLVHAVPEMKYRFDTKRPSDLAK